MAQPKKKNDADESIKIICRNKRALHEYNLFDTLECGIALKGTEVKSLRDGSASLEEAYMDLTHDAVEFRAEPAGEVTP